MIIYGKSKTEPALGRAFPLDLCGDPRVLLLWYDFLKNLQVCMYAVESLLWYDHVVIIYQSPALKYFQKHEKQAVHNAKEGRANLLTMWVISWNQSSPCSKPVFCRQQKQAKYKSLAHIHYLLCPDNRMVFGSQQRRPGLRRIIRASPISIENNAKAPIDMNFKGRILHLAVTPQRP